MAELDKGWTPVRRGEILCSPRCGGGCTVAAHDRAFQEVHSLCSRLGDGWEPEIWENLGWHYRAKRGVAAVHPTKNGSCIRGEWDIKGYTVYFNSAKQILGFGDTPEISLQNAIDQAQEFQSKFEADLNVLLMPHRH